MFWIPLFNRTATISALVLILSLVLHGCGGGSMGTGVEPKSTFSGSLSSERGQPIAGAVIRLIETGEQTQTGGDGRFLLESTFEGNDAAFEITAGDVFSTFELNDLHDDGLAVNLQLTLDLEQGTVSLTNLSITAKIQGSCDPYFENGRIIRQANAVPEGTTCPFRVRASAQSGFVDGLRFVLERRSCEPTASWIEIGSGFTGTSGPGRGEIAFRFSNSEDHCLYRIRVPVGSPPIEPQEFEVHTFRKQAFDAREDVLPAAEQSRQTR